MLSQYENFKAKQPDSIDTVQYPLLFRVEKDGRSHHILGWIHAVPLSVMPEFVHEIIEQSHLLLTESIATVNENTLQAIVNPEKSRYFLNSLKDSKGPFVQWAQAILQTLDIPFSVEQVHPAILVKLFLTQYGKFQRIDDATIQLFKIQSKPIVELNNTDELLRAWVEESELQDQQMFYWQTRGISIACQMQGHYPNSSDAQESIFNFLNSDLTQEELFEVDPYIRNIVNNQNFQWFEKFKSQHESGQDKIFLGCGFGHLFEENGLLSLLSQDGYTITRVTTLNSPSNKNNSLGIQ